MLLPSRQPCFKYGAFEATACLESSSEFLTIFLRKRVKFLQLYYGCFLKLSPVIAVSSSRSVTVDLSRKRA